MTVYGKIENGNFISAPNEAVEELLIQGYSAFTDEEAQSYITKELLKEQIDELDKKSIRAIRESGIKDETSGQTWVEYYTTKIKELRIQIADLT